MLFPLKIVLFLREIALFYTNFNYKFSSLWSKVEGHKTKQVRTKNLEQKILVSSLHNTHNSERCPFAYFHLNTKIKLSAVPVSLNNNQRLGTV